METTRKYTNLAPVCEETITHDMELITKAAEKNIGAELPEDFGVILDDCTFGSEHYMAVYGCYKRNGVRCCPLLSMAPVINGPDDCLNADTHMAALASFLPFFGCASHRLNLAVRSFLLPYEDDLDQVQLLMKHLRTIKQAAKLRLKTPLNPNCAK
ncbi:hypothetical protein PC116_g1988 [Phytophthora cactorum]|nr:hypothetical protein PC116_g1988 [Phytophthora cactorum]